MKTRKLQNNAKSARISLKGMALACLAGVILLPIMDNHSIVRAQSGMQNAEIAQTITLTVKDVTTEAAISLIAEHFGLKALIQMPLTDKISLDLKQSSFDEAMQRAAGGLPVDWMIENGRLHVFQPRETWSKFSEGGQGMNATGYSARTAEPQVSRIVPLGKRRAEDLQKLLKDLNPAISIVFDSPTNSLVLLGAESQVAEAEALCMSLDEMPVTERQASSTVLIQRQKYITEVFELEHADMEEVEKELGTVIQRQESGSSSSSTSTTTTLRDKEGKPIETEYFVIDKVRRIVLVHTTEEKYIVVKKYFDAINKPLAQVLIETQIVAVDSGFERDLGIKWNTAVGYNGPGNPWSTGGEQAAVLPAETILTGPQAFQFGKWNLTNLQAMLNTAETNNKAQVLSRPRIMALTGQPASIHVGTELPYTTSTTVTEGGNVTQNVEFKQIGVKLDVTPTIHKTNKTIRLHLIPEVSDSIGLAANGAPIISTRRSETTVELKDGETMVIGGLISSEDSRNGGGVPMLRDLPVLGKLFQFSKKTKKKTNLIILLTTRLISDEFKNEVQPKAVEEIVTMHGHPAVAEIKPSLASITESITPYSPAIEVKPATTEPAPNPTLPEREQKLKDREYFQKKLEKIQKDLKTN